MPLAATDRSRFGSFLLAFAMMLLLATSAGAQERSLPTDTTIVTTHEVTIKGQRVPYRATAGTQPVWDEDGMPIASLFYTLYERTGVSNQAARPLVKRCSARRRRLPTWRVSDESIPRVGMRAAHNAPEQ